MERDNNDKKGKKPKKSLLKRLFVKKDKEPKYHRFESESSTSSTSLLTDTKKNDGKLKGYGATSVASSSKDKEIPTVYDKSYGKTQKIRKSPANEELPPMKASSGRVLPSKSVSSSSALSDSSSLSAASESSMDDIHISSSFSLSDSESFDIKKNHFSPLPPMTGGNSKANSQVTKEKSKKLDKGKGKAPESPRRR